jgi:glutaredoxin
MFTVYSKVGCSHCEAIEKVFKAKDIQFEKKLLNVDFSREDFINKFGNSTFPRVLKEETLIGGAKETVVYLKDNGLV